MQIVRVTSREQLALFEAEVRAGIRSILESAGNPHDMTETEVLWDILTHVTDFGPAAALWFVVDESWDLQMFLSAKVYYDGPKTNGAITWMWSRAGGAMTPALSDVLDTWCLSQGCKGIYCSRTRGEPWFTAFVARYGFKPDSTVYRKELQHVGIERSDRRIESEAEHAGAVERAHDAGTERAEPADVRHSEPRADGADGAAPGDGDLCAAAAGGELHAGVDGEPRQSAGWGRRQPRGAAEWERWKREYRERRLQRGESLAADRTERTGDTSGVAVA